MTTPRTPPLRFALHLLLALAVLLQASMALAMRANLAGTAAPAEAPSLHRDHPGSAPSSLPPCHVVALPHSGNSVSQATPADCCDDGVLGESCRWACAQALSLPVALSLDAAPPVTSTDMPPPLLPPLRWTARSPLRPPIG